MECPLCHYKPKIKNPRDHSVYSWLLKRHMETNQRCQKMRIELDNKIEFNGHIELLRLENMKLKEQCKNMERENRKLKKELALLKK